MFFTALLCIFNNLVLQGQKKINMWVPATSAVSRLFHLFPAEHCSVAARRVTAGVVHRVRAARGGALAYILMGAH